MDRRVDPWMDRLSEYVDGELSAEERAELERHLSECFECRRAEADLRLVVARADALVDRDPANDLWSGIAARIRAADQSPARPIAQSPTPVIDLAAHRRPAERTGRRRFAFTLSQLAAASVALMIVSGSLVWLTLGQSTSGSTGSVGSAAPSAAVRTVADVEPMEDIADAVRGLELVLRQQRNQLDPVTVAVLEQNLKTIDGAITEARAALERDPSNLYLNQHLESTMKMKIQLLRTATSLRGTRI